MIMQESKQQDNVNPSGIMVAAKENNFSLHRSSGSGNFFLGGIFIILSLVVIHDARAILMPLALAFIFKLVLQPLLRLLQKLHIPRSAAAFLIIVLVISILVGLGTILSTPAASWAAKLPSSVFKLKHHLNFLSASIEKFQNFVNNAPMISGAADNKIMAVQMQTTRLSDWLIAGTGALVNGLFTTTLILFFLLAAGDTFLRRMVEILPRFKDKRQAVDISQQIEHNISLYLLTITLINVCVGIAAGAVMFFCGIDDPILWGTLAFLLNYIPIVGALVCAAIFFLASLLVTATLSAALVPASLYMLVHIVEGSFITPHLVARRFTLNPVLIILSLVFWYWMWGIAGAIMAMPMLAIMKIICDRIQPLMPFGHLLEG